VLGREGFELLSLIIAVHLPVMIVASIVLFGVFGHGGGSIDPLEVIRRFLHRIAKNPLVVGILCGLAWRITGLPLPPLAARLVDALAGIAGPLALFAMGLGLRKFGISGNVMPAIVLSALKLFLMPAVALGAALLLGLPPLAA